MQPPSRKLERLVIAGLTLVILVITLLFLRSKMLSESMPAVGQVPDFALTNQNGTVTTLADLRGKVWIADIIFTRCPAQCLRMTKNMSDLQTVLPDIKFVSLTADPAFDTPGILKTYSKRFNSSDNWIFLTGSKSNVYSLAMDGLKLGVEEIPPAERQSLDDLFIHSKKFMLVDKRGNLRGFLDKDKNLSVGFDGDESASNAAIIAAAKQLQRE